MISKKKALTGTIESIEEGVNTPSPNLGDLIEGFARRGFGAALLFPSILVVLPTGAIPGVPLLSGVLIMLISFQMIIGRKSPWVPKRLKKVTFKQKDISNYVDIIRPHVRKIDRYIYPRWIIFFNAVAFKFLAIIAFMLGAAIALFGIIPFAVLVPGVALTALSLGLMVKDGLLAMTGMILSSGCVYMLPIIFEEIKEWQ